MATKHGTYDQAGHYTPTSEYLKGKINYGADGSLAVIILSYVDQYEVVLDDL